MPYVPTWEQFAREAERLYLESPANVSYIGDVMFAFCLLLSYMRSVFC